MMARKKKQEAALTLRVYPVMQGEAHSYDMLREMGEWERQRVLHNLEMAVRYIKDDLEKMAANGGRMPSEV